MKKIFLSTMLMVSTLYVLADHFEFYYDAAGNRYQRVYITPRLANPDDTSQIAQNIGAAKITILPNPTNGAFAVRIDNLKDDEAAQILVYDIKGVLLSKTDKAGNSTSFDITNKPSGSYIIRVYIGDKKKEWRLLKM